MCGRFTLSTSPGTVAAAFGLADAPHLLPRYNVAPTQQIAVVGLKPDGVSRGLKMIRWGLIPNWATDPKKVPNPFNARAESVRDKPLFADRIEGGGRCLIPADGFCEWKAEGKKKVPHHFKLRSGAPFAFAGLYDVWRGDGKLTFSTCLITTTANDVVKPVHARMPVMLSPADFTRWLDRESELPDVLSLLRPYPAEAMEAVRVGPLVSKATNEGPACVEPAV